MVINYQCIHKLTLQSHLISNNKCIKCIVTSGFGEAIALKLTELGAKVFVVDIRDENLEILKSKLIVYLNFFSCLIYLYSYLNGLIGLGLTVTQQYRLYWAAPER